MPFLSELLAGVPTGWLPQTVLLGASQAFTISAAGYGG